MDRFVVILCFFCSSLPLFASPPTFWESFDSSPKIKSRKLLIQAQEFYRFFQNKKAIYFINDARKLYSSWEADWLYFSISMNLINFQNISLYQDSVSSLLSLGKDLLYRDPEYALAVGLHADIAILEMVLGEYEESEAHYKKFLESGSNREEKSITYSNLGDIFVALHKSELAEVCYQKSIEINSREEYPHIALAVLYTRLADWENAYFYLNLGLQLDPHIDWFFKSNVFFIPPEEKYFFASILYAGIGESTKAIASLQLYISSATDQDHLRIAKKLSEDTSLFISHFNK